MTAAPRTVFHFFTGARSFAVAALLAFASPAAAESTEPAKSAPIADANDKPGPGVDDPLEGLDLHDQPLGPTAKAKKGRKAPPAQQAKPGKSGASKT